MSPRPTRANEDLRRLDDDGYELDVRADGHLVVTHVPYVDSLKQRRFGVLAYPLSMSGDVINPPIDHMVWWLGDAPCDRDGLQLNLGNNLESHRVGDLDMTLRFSRKPAEGYKTHFEKVNSYVSIISSHALDIDPTATAQTYRIVEPSADASPFVYADTATARAGIGRIAERLKASKVAIVGLGGTGSYILDFIAKTPIQEIHLFDGDELASHNAFRSPGAASIAELRDRPEKVTYLHGIYSQMRRGIVLHGYLDDSNVDLLGEMDFVFLSLDRGKPKSMALVRLASFKVTFVDVGMGVYVVEGEDALGGTLRATLVTPDDQTAASCIDLTDADGDDIYSTNIQTVELNAFNAAMAVMAWKRYVGFYKDLAFHTDSAYQIGSNFLSGEGPNS